VRAAIVSLLLAAAAALSISPKSLGPHPVIVELFTSQG